jgi:hypothetical protein
MKREGATSAGEASEGEERRFYGSRKRRNHGFCISLS